MQTLDRNGNPIEAAVQFAYRRWTISATTINGLQEIGVITPARVLHGSSFAPTPAGVVAAMRYIDSQETPQG